MRAVREGDARRPAAPARVPGLRGVLFELLLLTLSSLLFALSFPSFLSRWGFAPLAFVALVPLFVVVRRAGWLRVLFYGAFFGFLSYALFNFWLAKFHPLALLIVPPIHAAYFLLLFPLLKAAVVLFPTWGYLLQAALWVGYEYLKAQGFLAYSYGILGYSQYLFQPLVQSAGLAGVWGLSLLVVFPSAFLGRLLAPLAQFPEAGRLQGLRSPRLWGPAAAYAGVFLLALGWGTATRVDLREARPWRVALVQQNVDPWRGGNRAYRRSLAISLRLSREAAAGRPARSSSGRRPPSCRPSTGTPATGRTRKPATGERAAGLPGRRSGCPTWSATTTAS